MRCLNSHVSELLPKKLNWSFGNRINRIVIYLIGYFEVTWHLKMKLFPAKISERATLPQSVWRQRVITVHCYPCTVERPPPLQRGLMNFQLQNFQLYYISLKDWSLWKQLILFPLNLNVSVVKCLLFYNLAKLISLYKSSEELVYLRAKLRLDFRFSYPVKAYAWI